MRFAELDAVTLDAYGTLVELRDPVSKLIEALRSRGVERGPEAVADAFAAEAAFYRTHSVIGRDEHSLVGLQRDCAAVFLGALDTDLVPDEFAPAFVGSLEFRPLAGVPQALAALAARGLALAVVSNWDVTLHKRLAALGLTQLFAAVVSSAEAGAAKPEPAVFEQALAELGVPARRALHAGDDRADEEGARAAGMSFRPAPLANVLVDGA